MRNEVEEALRKSGMPLEDARDIADSGFSEHVDSKASTELRAALREYDALPRSTDVDARLAVGERVQNAINEVQRQYGAAHGGLSPSEAAKANLQQRLAAAQARNIPTDVVDGVGKIVPLDIHGIPDSTFRPKPTITVRYSRPFGTTSAQRNAVQGLPCACCGTTAPGLRIADHRTGLAIEYFATGTNNRAQQETLAAVQAHYITCSATQGGKASNFTTTQHQILGI